MAERKKKQHIADENLENATKAEKNEAKQDLQTNKDLQDANDRFIRLAADFDNYKKRTSAEKENLRALVVSDTVQMMLPILDNLERASCVSCEENSSLMDGVLMVLSQAKQSFETFGITSYGQRGDDFNPEIHNAVMTCADEELESGKIADVLQKGYKIGDKIIRHALVRVVE